MGDFARFSEIFRIRFLIPNGQQSAEKFSELFPPLFVTPLPLSKKRHKSQVTKSLLNVGQPQPSTVGVKIITGSLVTLENLLPDNYCCRYRLEIRMNYHYRYRLGPRSRPFISIDSQLPSRKSFELIFSKLPLPLPSWNVFELER